jgi:hypothetical protein
MYSNQVIELIQALREISHGGKDTGQLGLQGVTAALGGVGEPGHTSVAGGLHDVASAIRELAEVVRTIATPEVIHELAFAIRHKP